jgi:hypothetical protein
MLLTKVEAITAGQALVVVKVLVDQAVTVALVVATTAVAVTVLQEAAEDF